MQASKLSTVPGSASRSATERFRQLGTSLPFALIALAGLSVMGVSMMRSTTTSALISGNLGFRETAMRATDVAVEAAVSKLTAVKDRDADSKANLYFASIDSPMTEIPAAARFSAYSADDTTGVEFRYSIERMCDSGGSASTAYCAMNKDSSYYRITGEAKGPKGATQISQVFVTLNEARGPCGIMTQESMHVSGQSSSLGKSKCFHSNEDITLSGGSETPGLVASAAGTAVSKGGKEYVKTESKSSARTLPAVVPVNHKPYARQVFKADGSTITGSGFVAGDWKWDSGIKTWIAEKDYTSTCPPPGLYYFESNVEIPKSFGTKTKPCELSFIAEGSMKFNGTVYLENFRSTNDTTRTPHPAETDNVFLMAGGDMQLPGGSIFNDSIKSAMIAGGSQIDVNGSIELQASLVSRSDPLPKNAQDWVKENKVSGQLDQTYDGGGAASGALAATRHSWRAASN